MKEQGQLMSPNFDDLLSNLDKIKNHIEKDYLSELKNGYNVLDFEDYNDTESGSIKISYESNIRGIRIDRWVYDREESISDRFKNILGLFAGGDSNIALVINRKPQGTEMSFVIKNETTNGVSRFEDSKNNLNLLKRIVEGNFPGTKTNRLIELNEETLIGNPRSIACVTSITSEKSEKFISQGLEKLLDGVVPQKDEDGYTVVIIAEPISAAEISSMKVGYEEMATALAPYAGYQYSVGKNESENTAEFNSASDTEGINKSISKTNGVNVGLFAGITKGVNAQAGISELLVGGVSAGGVVGANIGFSHSRTRTEGEHAAETITKGKTFGITTGKTTSATYNYKAYGVANLLKEIENQIERIQIGRALGMWKMAAYIMSQESNTSISVANYLRSLSRGEDSYLEPSVINEWHIGRSALNLDNIQEVSENERNFKNIHKFLQAFTHPVFANQNDLISQSVNSEQFIDFNKIYCVSPASSVTTNELAEEMAFPRKSILGLPVLECAEFGREVISHDQELKDDYDIGSIYHMHHQEQKRVKLDKNSLAAHTFITGSTGSGKSNTIYQILNKATADKNDENNVTFLVIEPAKGEYKDTFGHREDVTVYGTNPQKSDVLRINPFRFPKDTHVLEHLDRLIEIFNVCWPMYAAMPAVLKEAVERAYVNAGWDLTKSVNQVDEQLYPNFHDVLNQVQHVLEESQYSADNKGDYIGALSTRLKSLSNGINGMIFVQNDLPDEVLFDRNVVVDLSRVGSMETKALIMGLLVLKLQEYRMSNTNKSNNRLKHITVLEEAHNLLKRTSTEQNSESSSLIGKSVEMLANAIAEMRTYGEGFIIADQSPGLLDLSVIRNTNTKIILRLPDFSDRELVGKAAGLNDSQIIELSKLQRGVAAIYQNDWINPVLCKIDYFGTQPQYSFKRESAEVEEKENELMLEILMDKELVRNVDRIEQYESRKDIILKSSLQTDLKRSVLQYLATTSKLDRKELRRTVAYQFFNSVEAINQSSHCSDIGHWSKSMCEQILPSIKERTQKEQDEILMLIIGKHVGFFPQYNRIRKGLIEKIGSREGWL